MPCRPTAWWPLLATGCAGAATIEPIDEIAPADAQAPEAPTSDPRPDTAAPPTAACSPTLAPGRHTLRLRHDGEARSYELIVPDAPGALPLVLAFHGWLETPDLLLANSHLDVDAEREGFLLAAPAGLSRSWDGGACCGASVDAHADDVGFARAVVAHVAARACVDPARIYATGFSNGAFLTHRLACQASDLFAAAAPVSGMMTIDPDTCVDPAPLLHLHGTADVVVPYPGNALLNYPSFDASNARWRAIRGCAGRPGREAREQASCETWAACDAGGELQACTLPGWPHQWPTRGSPLDANAAIWTFFRQHTLGERAD